MSKIAVPDGKALSAGGYVSEDFKVAKFYVTGYSDDWFFKKTNYHDSIPAIWVDPKILTFGAVIKGGGLYWQLTRD
jgi:hypothetical protein